MVHMVDFELLIVLPLHLECWDHSDAAQYMVYMVYMVLEIKPWTLSSNPSLLLLGVHALLDKV